MSKDTPLYEQIARDAAKEIDKKVLGGDPDNNQGLHFHDIQDMTRIISEYAYILEQDHQIKVSQERKRIREAVKALEKEAMNWSSWDEQKKVFEAVLSLLKED